MYVIYIYMNVLYNVLLLIYIVTYSRTHSYTRTHTQTYTLTHTRTHKRARINPHTIAYTQKNIKIYIYTGYTEGSKMDGKGAMRQVEIRNSENQIHKFRNSQGSALYPMY